MLSVLLTCSMMSISPSSGHCRLGTSASIQIAGQDPWPQGILARLIKAKGYQVVNIDSTLCLEAPKIKPYIVKMQEAISAVLNLPLDTISIKATTTEKMGFAGREEGLVAYATVLLEKASLK